MWIRKILCLQIGRICTIILLIWIISVAAILPAMFCTGTYDIYFPNTDLALYHLCMEQWPHPWVHTVYSFLLMMVMLHFSVHEGALSVLSPGPGVKGSTEGYKM